MAYEDDIVEIKTSLAVLLDRSANTQKTLDSMNGTVKALDKQVDDNCKDIAKLQERQGIWAGIHTGLTVLVGTIAAYVGVQR